MERLLLEEQSRHHPERLRNHSLRPAAAAPPAPSTRFQVAQIAAALAHLAAALVFSTQAVLHPKPIRLTRVTCAPLYVARSGSCAIDWTSSPTRMLWLLAGFAYVTWLSHTAHWLFAQHLWRYIGSVGPNWFRWAEYAVTCGLMNVVLITTAGESSVTAAWLAFGVAAAWMPAGYMAELLDTPHLNHVFAWLGAWLPSAMSYVAFCVAMASSFHYFASGNAASAARQAWLYGDDDDDAYPTPPSWVYGVVVGVLVLYTGFPVAAVVTRVRRLSPHTREWIYLALSFSSKHLLLWTYYFGVVSSARA